MTFFRRRLLVATFLRISNVFPGKLTKNALKTLQPVAGSWKLEGSSRQQPFLSGTGQKIYKIDQNLESSRTQTQQFPILPKW